MSRLFTDPVAQVVIKDIESSNEWKWGSPEFPFLTSVSFTHQEQSINAFSIGIDMPYELGIGYLDRDESPFKLNNIVKARIGYATGGWTNWEAGFLRDGAAGLSVTPDGISGTLEVSWTGTEVAGYTVSKSLLDEAGMDVEKLLELIALKLGLEVEFSESSLNYIGPWNQVLEETIEDHRRFINGLESKTYMGALDDICKRSNIVYRMGYKSGKRMMFFYSEEDRMGGTAADDSVRKYVVRGILDEDRNQYPCYELKPQADQMSWTTRSATGAASGVVAKGIDTSTGEDVDVEVLPQQHEFSIDGYIVHTEPQDIKYTDPNGVELIADSEKEGGEAASYMSAPVLPGGREIFENQVKKFGLQGDPGQLMEIKTIGVPEEMVGNRCVIFGAGAVFNDFYYIEGLTHSWIPGNWDMSLSLHRRGGKTLAGDKIETAGGQMS